MEEILKIAAKIIKSKLVKNSEILFLAYSNDYSFELYLKPVCIYEDFIKYCIINNIKSGVLIIRYKDIKRFNIIIENVQNFLDYIFPTDLEISNVYILKRNIYRNITSDFFNLEN